MQVWLVSRQFMNTENKKAVWSNLSLYFILVMPPDRIASWSWRSFFSFFSFLSLKNVSILYRGLPLNRLGSFCVFDCIMIKPSTYKNSKMPASFKASVFTHYFIRVEGGLCHKCFRIKVIMTLQLMSNVKAQIPNEGTITQCRWSITTAITGYKF